LHSRNENRLTDNPEDGEVGKTCDRGDLYRKKDGELLEDKGKK
jgi:hypothetical protein